MNKIFTLLALLSFQLNAFTQVTQGEIYNFEIGDVLQVEYTSSSFPYMYELDTIVDKVISGNFIEYTIHRHTKLAGPPPYPQYSSSVETLTVFPSSPAQHTLQMQSCLPFLDTVDVGQCNQGVYTRVSQADTSCFEPPYWISHLYEGLGGPYFYGNDATNPGWYTRKWLIYSNTAQWGECGEYYSWFVGVEELSETPKVLVKIVDLLGRETEFEPNKVLIYIYSDGSTEKKCSLNTY